MLSTIDEIKVAAIAAIIRSYTGSSPNITVGHDKEGEFKRISFTDEQIKKLSGEVEKQVAKAPGRVRIDTDGIFTPIIMKKAAWPLGLTALGSFLLGKGFSK